MPAACAVAASMTGAGGVMLMSLNAPCTVPLDEMLEGSHQVGPVRRLAGSAIRARFSQSICFFASI